VNTKLISLLTYTSIGALALTAISCHSPSPDWNGTWKLDQARSHIPERIFTISMTPDGMYHSGSGGETANFRCDGKGYDEKNTTAFCTQKDSSELEIVHFKNGSKLFTVHWKLSPDGKTLTIESSRFHTDGSVTSKETQFARTSGSDGFAGKWRNLNPLNGRAPILQLSIGSNALHYTFPETEIQVDAFLDGTDADIHGPLVSQGTTIALRERGPRELSSTTKENGRVVSVGSWQISADGRLLTTAYWAPSKPSNKEVLVYDKQ